MNIEFFIAKRISFSGSGRKNISYLVLRLAIGAVELGIVVMLISVSVLTGFQEEIENKVTGFASHITIKNRSLNFTFETSPINKNQPFYPGLTDIEGIKHIQVYATKPGIIKTKSEIQGIVLNQEDHLKEKTPNDLDLFRSILQ